MRRFAWLTWLLWLASAAFAQYWTQWDSSGAHHDGLGMVNPIEADWVFYRSSNAPLYTLGSSIVSAVTDIVVDDSVASGGTLYKADGYYYLTAGIPLPASMAVVQDATDFTLFQISINIDSNDIDTAWGVNSTHMQDHPYPIAGTIIVGATEEVNGKLDYAYLGYAGSTLFVRFRVPDTYAGSTLYVLGDARTHDGDGYLLQHGYTTDGAFTLSNVAATPTPVPPPPTPTPTVGPTVTPTPIPTVTPTLHSFAQASWIYFDGIKWRAVRGSP